jgi:hypothetical protein
VILILLVGFLIFFSAQAQEEWSLYMVGGYGLGCDEYKYGTEYVGTFSLPYNDYIAGSGRYGDGDYLWNSKNYPWEGNDVVLLEPYTGEILDSFYTEIDGYYMGFDGEYLWFGHYITGIQCVEVGGDPGPYPPIEDPDYFQGLEGYDGYIYNYGVMYNTTDVIKKFDRNGNLIYYFELDRP